jgi:N6-adenosine-specific RNA methylase IME4
MILPPDGTMNNPLRSRHYRVIYADPPWTFATYSDKGKGRSAEAHYDCMSIEDIAALPVSTWAADDAALFLWVTKPLLMKMNKVIQAWGFDYKTVGFTWAKTKKHHTGSVFDDDDFPIGCGYYTRANPEMCLLATRGKPLERKSKAVRELITAPRREHSRKPGEAYDRIEALFDGPYLEMFARQSRPGGDGERVVRSGLCANSALAIGAFDSQSVA